MNDRIKELLVKAGVYDCDVNDPEFVVSEEQKKFAELIVRECAQVGVNAFERNRTTGLDDIRYAIRGNIMKHFGVEE